MTLLIVLITSFTLNHPYITMRWVWYRWSRNRVAHFFWTSPIASSARLGKSWPRCSQKAHLLRFARLLWLCSSRWPRREGTPPCNKRDIWTFLTLGSVTFDDKVERDGSALKGRQLLELIIIHTNLQLLDLPMRSHQYPLGHVVLLSDESFDRTEAVKLLIRWIEEEYELYLRILHLIISASIHTHNQWICMRCKSLIIITLGWDVIKSKKLVWFCKGWLM